MGIFIMPIGVNLYYPAIILSLIRRLATPNCYLKKHKKSGFLSKKVIKAEYRIQETGVRIFYVVVGKGVRKGRRQKPEFRSQEKK
jgi:hypothetical protein